MRSSGPRDPRRSRTCVRCVRSSRPTLGRTGRLCRLAGPIRTDARVFLGLLGYRLPQRRRWRESGPLERVTTTKRRTPGSGPGGIGPTREGPAIGRAPARVRTERVELSWTAVRRLLRPVRLPFPPRPHAEPGEGRHVVGPTITRLRGPRRTRTVFVLLAGEVHRHLCVGPSVRGAGVEPAVPKRLGYGQVPSHDGVPRWTGGFPRQGMARHPIRLLAISSVFKDLFGRDR